MMDRRHFVIAGGAFILAPSHGLAALPVPPGGTLSFRVLRKGSSIGTHALTFSPTTGGLVVKIAVDLVVKLGPVPLYRYTHRATETWRGDVVVSIDAETDDNGKRLRVSGERKGEGLAIQSTTSGSYQAPANALPATHWNRRMLDGPFINTQTGELTRATVTPRGQERIETASGPVTARRYALSGPVSLETWYDDGPAWVGLRFTADDGTPITYRRA